jgi:hypothetical protein
VVGLENCIGVGCSAVLPSGHIGWYETPSNPVLVNVHPDTWYLGASEPGKQKMSSPSVGRVFAPSPSVLPAGHAIGLPWASSPNGDAGIGVGPLQNWKCPISVSKATL